MECLGSRAFSLINFNVPSNRVFREAAAPIYERIATENIRFEKTHPGECHLENSHSYKQENQALAAMKFFANPIPIYSFPKKKGGPGFPEPPDFPNAGKGLLYQRHLHDLAEFHSGMQPLRGKPVEVDAGRHLRSEEHTSELQSHSFISYAVF